VRIYANESYVEGKSRLTDRTATIRIKMRRLRRYGRKYLATASPREWTWSFP